MAPIQYGCNESEKESVLASCRRSDRILQLVLGDTAYVTARRWGILIILVILAAIVASAVGVSPR